MAPRWSSYINRKFGTRILSKWIVLCFDIMLTMFTYSMAYILRYNFNLEQISYTVYVQDMLLTTGVFFVSYISFKSYDGIIRHSGEADAKRLVLSGITATIICISLSIVGKQVENAGITLPISIAIIHSSINIALLLFSRYVIKVLFYQATRNNAVPIPVIIYGAGRRGIQVLQALRRDTEHNYQIQAFLDDNPSKFNKTIEGIRIFSSAKLPELLSRLVVKELIIGIHNPKPENKLEVVNVCLERQVIVKSVPPVEDWISNKLQARQIKSIDIEDLLGREPIRLQNDHIKNAIAGKTVLITGAAGSIGSELVRQIIEYQPGKLILIDQAESDLYDLKMELMFKLQHKQLAAQFIIADITHEDRIKHIFETTSPQLVFHAAAYKHVPLMEEHALEAIHVNIFGTIHIVNLSMAHQVERCVLISTDKAINPTSVMGATKRAAEIYIQEKSRTNSVTTFITTRFGNVLGSQGSVVHYFHKQIEAGGPLTITDPEVSRFFMTIPEACQLVLEAAVMGKTSEIYTFDMGEPVKILDLAKKMVLLSGLVPEKDIKFTFTGLRPGEKLHEEVIHADENTLPTHHDKIRIASTAPYPADQVEIILQHLYTALQRQEPTAAVRALKQLIPEYMSNNSGYSSLDRPDKASLS